MKTLAVIASILLGCRSFCSVIEVGAASDLKSTLESARAGDTIFVQAGRYEGNLLLDRRLTLIGIGKPIIKGEGTGSVLMIAADSCVVRGFVIERSGGVLFNEDSGILLKSDCNLIEENELRDVLFGIYLLESSGNIIRRNSIRGRQWLDVGERGSGFHIWNSHGNTFLENVVTGARDGMYIQNGNKNRIDGNEIYNVRYGLHYMYSDSNSFTGNRFQNNMAGAAIMYSRHLTFRRNAFVRNRGVSSFGILFQDCHNSIADSNLIADNGVGMFFESSGDNLFRFNTIAANDFALQIYTNSERNVFTENAFVDNINPLVLVGKRTTTRWSLDGKGNYWSQYGGFDFNGDGIGDRPLRIQNAFDYLEGSFPRLRLYLYSPASQALEVALRAFPILEISREIDEHPLMDRPDDPMATAAFIAPGSGWRASLFIASLTVVGLLGLIRLRRRTILAERNV